MAWTSPVSALCVMLLFGNHVEAMIVPQSVPNGVSQNLAGVLINELRFACPPLGFLSGKGGQREV